MQLRTVRSHHSLQQGKGASILEGVWAAHTSTLGPSVAGRDHSRPGPQAVTLLSRWRGSSLIGVQQVCCLSCPRSTSHLQVLKWIRGLTNGKHLVTHSGGDLLSLGNGWSHSSHRRKSCREIGPWGRAWVDQISPAPNAMGRSPPFCRHHPALMPQTDSFLTSPCNGPPTQEHWLGAPGGGQRLWPSESVP